MSSTEEEKKGEEEDKQESNEKEEAKEESKEKDTSDSVERRGEDYEILKEEFPNYDLSFKIIVIGNAGVGKSCLSIQATKKKIRE